MTDLSRYYDESYPPSLWAPDSTVASINPNTAAVGAAPFTLTVTGTGFTADSVVSFDGDERPTTYVSATQLTAAIASPVAPARTVPVTVDSGGSSSFTVTAAVGEEPPPDGRQGGRRDARGPNGGRCARTLARGAYGGRCGAVHGNARSSTNRTNRRGLEISPPNASERNPLANSPTIRQGVTR